MRVCAEFRCLQEAGIALKKGEGSYTELTLRRLGRQVGDEGDDRADVGDDPEDDGDDREPQGVTRRLARCLEVALRPCFVCLVIKKIKIQDQNRH